jgi:hypothetical protein
MLNVDLKIALLKTFGSQIVAARRLKIPENKLSHFVRCHDEPSPRQREILRKALGADFFAQQENGQQATGG